MRHWVDPTGLRIGLALLILVALEVPASADLRLERLRSAQTIGPDGEIVSSQDRTDLVFIAEDSVRLDAGSHSIIVRRGDGVYLHVDHEAKAYVQLTLPLRLEDLLTEQEKKCLRQYPQALAGPVATVTLTDERRMIAGYEARRIRTEWAHFMNLEFEEDQWVTHGLPPEAELFSQLLVRHRGILSPVYRGWIHEVVEFGGYSIEGVTTLRRQNGTRVVRQRLGTVTEAEPDATRYLPPDGYSPTLGRPPLDVGCLGPPTP